MAAIYNLEFTRVDTELSIYINGRLRANKISDPQLRINTRYQLYVERDHPVQLSIVFFKSGTSTPVQSRHCEQTRVAFTLYKSGSRRPIAMIHDNWDLVAHQGNVKEYSYLLK